MKELKTLEKVINKALSKGVFDSTNDITETIKALDAIFEKLQLLEKLQQQQQQKGTNNA